MQVPRVNIPHVFTQYGAYPAVHCINVPHDATTDRITKTTSTTKKNVTDANDNDVDALDELADDNDGGTSRPKRDIQMMVGPPVRPPYGR